MLKFFWKNSLLKTLPFLTAIKIAEPELEENKLSGSRPVVGSRDPGHIPRRVSLQEPTHESDVSSTEATELDLKAK